MPLLSRMAIAKRALPCRKRIAVCAPLRMMLARPNLLLDCARARARSLLACARVHHHRANFCRRHHRHPLWHAVSSSFQALSGSRGAKRLPMDAGGSLAAAISSGRSTRARHTVPTPSSTAYAELHRQNYTILKCAASRSECAQLLASATREEYKEILGDKLRLHAPNATSAPLAARIIERVSAPCHGR